MPLLCMSNLILVFRIIFPSRNMLYLQREFESGLLIQKEMLGHRKQDWKFFKECSMYRKKCRIT